MADAGANDEDDFQAVYGAWQPLSVLEVADLMRGFPHPWWIVGGHAIEAFTGVRRPHEDIDVSFFPDALQAFRTQVGGRYHLWSNDGGTFRLLGDQNPEPLKPLAQIWARENAQSPWVLDVTPSPSVGGKWQSKRDREHLAELDDVTWADARGVRFLNPEIVLRFKATLNRERDRLDLGSAWPLLTDEKRTWLRDAVQSAHPSHPWGGLLRA